MSRETSNLGLILYDPSEDKDVKVRDVINKVLGFTDSNTIKIDAKTKDIDTNIKTLHDSIIGTDGNVVFYNKQEVFLAVHPVGSIFLSTDGTEPAELYGGTWEQIKDVFLLGAGNTYTAGNTGGEKTHKHNLSKNGYATIGNNASTAVFRSGSKLVKDDANDVYMWTHDTDSRYTSSDEHYNYIEYVGLGGKTDTTSSMPPYFVVYMWRRVA